MQQVLFSPLLLLWMVICVMAAYREALLMTDWAALPLCITGGQEAGEHPCGKKSGGFAWWQVELELAVCPGAKRTDCTRASTASGPRKGLSPLLWAAQPHLQHWVQSGCHRRGRMQSYGRATEMMSSLGARCVSSGWGHEGQIAFKELWDWDCLLIWQQWQLSLVTWLVG